jgi:hypothetical protein
MDWNALLSKKIDAPHIPTITPPSKAVSQFLKERTKEATEVNPVNDPFLDW